MLKKENRLTKIRSVVQKKISTPLFNLSVGKNNLEVNRFAFVVSKKVDARATVRNRLKRRTRAIIEEMIKELPGGNDFAFYLKKELVNAKTDEIRQLIKKYIK